MRWRHGSFIWVSYRIDSERQDATRTTPSASVTTPDGFRRANQGGGQVTEADHVRMLPRYTQRALRGGGKDDHTVRPAHGSRDRAPRRASRRDTAVLLRFTELHSLPAAGDTAWLRCALFVWRALRLHTCTRPTASSALLTLSFTNAYVAERRVWPCVDVHPARAEQVLPCVQGAPST